MCHVIAYTSVYVCNVSTSLPNKGAPQDKCSVNTPSLPTINIYIDPRGTLFGAALLCFTLPALLVKSVIDHYSVDLALGVSREFAIG